MNASWRHELGSMVQFCACTIPIIIICRVMLLSCAARIRYRERLSSAANMHCVAHSEFAYMAVSKLPGALHAMTIDVARYDIISIWGERVTTGERIGLTKDGFDPKKLSPEQIAALKQAQADATVVASRQS